MPAKSGFGYLRDAICGDYGQAGLWLGGGGGLPWGGKVVGGEMGARFSGLVGELGDGEFGGSVLRALRLRVLGLLRFVVLEGWVFEGVLRAGD